MSRGAGSPLGDFLRAVCAMGAEADVELRAKLADLFGLSLRVTADSEPGSETGLDQGPVPTAPTDVTVDKKDETSATDAGPTGNLIPSTVRTMGTSSGLPPDWLATALMLPPRTPRRLPPKMSLLEPLWTRSILTTALCTEGEAGEIDVDQLVEHVVSARPVRSIPVRRSPTMARGIYAWVDRSESMQLFVQDQTQIIGQLRDAVGLLGLNLRQTKGVPERSRDFAQGVPHLVLSDLGFVDLPESFPADPPEAWVEWAEWVQEELEARVVALVPRQPSAYPSAVQRTLRLLHWDRDTSVQSVRRALT
jgi:hypothetical protein